MSMGIDKEGSRLKALNRVIDLASETSLYEDESVEPLDSLSEISTLPITEKSDLSNRDYRDTLACPPKRLTEIHTSSGTTGEPTVLALTQTDLDRSTNALARTWELHGVNSGDCVQMMVSFGMFTAGHLNQYALQSLGACVVPSGVKSSRTQISEMQRFAPDYIVAVSSYYLRLAHVIQENNLSIPDLDGLVGGGVPVTEKMRERIESVFDAPFYNQYGLAEVNTGIAGECEVHDGLHLRSDYVYPEIVDPETHEPLPAGEEGVLVLTPLQREGQPLLRYVTNDRTAITYEACECGRTTPRIEPISGRIDDTMFVRGAKLKLSEVRDGMESADDLVDPFRWRLEIGHEDGRDTLDLLVDWQDGPKQDALRDRLSHYLPIKIDHIKEWYDISGQKPTRVLDNRERLDR